MVSGLKIPNDDEEFEAGMFERFFNGIYFGVQFIYLKMLPFEDEPFYFESEEEAVELWAKHFPPGYNKLLSIFFIHFLIQELF